MTATPAIPEPATAEPSAIVPSVAAPTVAVIIPVFRDWSDAGLCVAALQAQTRAPDCVVFVNNDPASPPPADFVLPEGWQILDEAKPGSYAARNRALAEVKADIYFFTDADCRPDPGWIAAGLSALANGADRAGGPVKLVAGTPPNMAESYDLLTGFRQDRNLSRGWSVTANMATRAEVFAKVGPFDDRLMSGGDQDWGKRAEAAGVPIASVPAMLVLHPARKDLDLLLRKIRRVEGGKLFQKLEKRSRAQMIAGFFLLLPFKALPSIRSSIRLWRLDAPAQVRAYAVWVHYLMRLTRIRENARVLFLNRGVERR